VLLVASPVSFVLPSRWQASSSLCPLSSPSTSLVSTPRPLCLLGSSPRLDDFDSTSRLSTLVFDLDLTLDSPSTPSSPSFSSGGSVGSLGRRSSPSACPQVFLAIAGCRGRSRHGRRPRSRRPFQSTSTYRLVSLILSPSSRTLGGLRCLVRPFDRLGRAGHLHTFVVQPFCTSSGRPSRRRQSRRVGSTAYLTPPRAVRSGVSSSRRLGRARRLHVFVPAFCSTSWCRRRRVVRDGGGELVVVGGDGVMGEVRRLLVGVSPRRSTFLRSLTSLPVLLTFLVIPGLVILWPSPFDIAVRRLHTTCLDRRTPLDLVVTTVAHRLSSALSVRPLVVRRPSGCWVVDSCRGRSRCVAASSRARSTC
jgi:hypothetical protein